MSLLDDKDGFDDLLPQLPADKYAAIPEELKQSQSWLVYRMEPGINGRKNKIPYDPATGKKANDPKLGVTFEQALVSEKDYSGLGFYVEAPYLVIDIDGCVNRATGDVEPYAVKIVQELNSYTEASPSGTGLHIWIRGAKPGDKCRKGIEIYSTKRFLTVTGFWVEGTPKEIREVDIKPLYDQMLAGDFTQPAEENSQKADESQNQIKVSTEVQHAGTFVTTKLQLLMTGTILSTKPFIVGDEHGNTVQFPSQSEADGSLAVLLAFKHKGDAAGIDGDFRVSSLYRSKWDRVDYRDNTIKSAIAFFEKTRTIEEPVKPKSETVVGPTVTQEDDDEDEEVTALDTALPDFPEFTGSLAVLCDSLSPDIPRAFKFVAGLSHIGLIRSGLDTLAAEPHVQPRFYAALIAQPGRGKTAAINEVTKVMKAVSNQYQVWPSIDSGPALVDAFNDQIKESIIRADGSDNIAGGPIAKIMLSPDELKGVFEKAKITAGSRNSMLDELLKLYEGNSTGNRVRGAKINIRIEGAHLGLLGGATESGYTSMWTGTGGAADGLQSRFIPIGIADRKMPPMQRPPDLGKLTEITQVLIEQMKQPGTRFELSGDALTMYEDWWKQKDQAHASETRIDGIVKRLLIVLARTNDVDMIHADLMEQAIEFGDFVIACRSKYNPLDASTWAQAFENLIIQAHQERGPMTPNKCRKVVRPERRPGGVGPYLQAHKNLTQAGVLRESGRSQRSPIYRLSL